MKNNRQIYTKTKCQVELNNKCSDYSKQGENIGSNTSQSILKIIQQQTQNTRKKRK